MPLQVEVALGPVFVISNRCSCPRSTSVGDVQTITKAILLDHVRSDQLTGLLARHCPDFDLEAVEVAISQDGIVNIAKLKQHEIDNA
ncbi:hypothetical protein N9L47_11735 [Rhodobacteraceae bacterium]|nr:hypothetical protein [Paracoccaceae bacterium]